jgi:integrase/recombinase XerD
VQLIWRGIESYLQELIANAVRSQLANSGQMTQVPVPSNETTKASAIAQNEPPPKETKPVASPPPSSGSLISDAIDSYLKDVEPPQREPKTYDEYRLVLYKFRDTCKKRYIQEVDRDDLLDFRRVLYSLGNEARTVFNRMGIVLQLLKLFGIEKLLKKGDKPKFVRNMREMYQTEDLNALFKACTADEKVRYLFFLLTGERDKEVRYTAWPDIDFVRNCVRVTSKKQLGFKPKDKEEREIPVPSSLLTALRQYKAWQSGPNPHNLVFPTAGGKADRKFENKLKKIAYRAGLNCGHCLSRHGNKCVEGPHCGNWFLHKFRHTLCHQVSRGRNQHSDAAGMAGSQRSGIYDGLFEMRRKDIQQLVDNSELASLASHVSIASEFRKTDVPVRKIGTDSGNVIRFSKHGHPQSV